MVSARHKASAAQATARLCTPILASHSPRCAELSLLTPPLYPCQTRNHRHRWYLEPRGCPQDFLLGHCPAPLSCWHHGMAQHRGTPGASHPTQGRSSGSWEATAQFPVLCQPVASSVEQSWCWHCQLSLTEPHSCSLHPAKAGISLGCPGAGSQPCCSPFLSLSHGSPGYSVSCFCHTTGLPKPPEQPWGTAVADEGRSQLLTSWDQTPGTPHTQQG